MSKVALYALTFIALIGMCLGCKKPRAGLEGKWDLYVPIFGMGHITFTGSQFTQQLSIPLSDKGDVVYSGTYTVEADHLILSVKTASGIASLPAGPQDYVMEWKGDDIVYLSIKTEIGGMKMAMARNGAKPDLYRLGLSYSKKDYAPRAGGGWKVQKLGGDSQPAAPTPPPLTINPPTQPLPRLGTNTPPPDAGTQSTPQPANGQEPQSTPEQNPASPDQGQSAGAGASPPAGDSSSQQPPPAQANGSQPSI